MKAELDCQQLPRDVIAAIETAFQVAIKNEELRTLMAKVVSAFQAHLVMEERLSSQIAGR